eukprot:1183153-Prorocentrum_minimum.AAC.1
MIWYLGGRHPLVDEAALRRRSWRALRLGASLCLAEVLRVGLLPRAAPAPRLPRAALARLAHLPSRSVFRSSLHDRTRALYIFSET